MIFIITFDTISTVRGVWRSLVARTAGGLSLIHISILDQIVKQLAKLVDVRDIKVLDPSDSVVRETVLVKVAAAPEQRQGIVSIADIFRAKVVDVSKDSLIVEMTGSKTKLEAFINLMGDYEILELARAGVMGLERGSHGVKFL